MRVRNSVLTPASKEDAGGASLLFGVVLDELDGLLNLELHHRKEVERAEDDELASLIA